MVISALALEHSLAEYCTSIRRYEGGVVEVEQEVQLWLCAATHYGADLAAVVSAATTSFRRKPGLDPLTRIYQANVGAHAFEVLKLTLPKQTVPPSDGNHIHVRQQLRNHLCYHLLKSLVGAQAAPPELRDTLFSVDLGL